MKSIPASLLAHYQSGTTTTAMLWRVTLADGSVLGFTDHDQDIDYLGVTYTAEEGFARTAITGNASLSVDNLDVTGFLQSPALTIEAINKGLWDFAAVDIWRVNWADTSMGHEVMRTGTLGEVSADDLTFTAEMRGLTQRLAQNVGALYLPTCDAEFGDARCTKSLAGLTVTGSVTGVSGNRVVGDSARTEAAGTYTNGVLTWTGGANVGMQEKVRVYTVGQIDLQMPAPYTIVLGDTYSLVQGCAKSPDACKAYSNFVNFRGDPFVTGRDKVIFNGANP